MCIQSLLSPPPHTQSWRCVFLSKASKLCFVKQYATAGLGMREGGGGVTVSRPKDGLLSGLLKVLDPMYAYQISKLYLVQIKRYITREKFTDKQTDGQRDWQTGGRTDKSKIIYSIFCDPWRGRNTLNLKEIYKNPFCHV